MIDASWDPTFVLRSDVFRTIAPVASLFERHACFPTPEEIDEVLASRAGVRFVRQKPRPRRRRARTSPPPSREQLYDARIVDEGVVPTRAGSWHDFLNALVWATFPESKRALHARQHRLVVPGAPRRVPALDALALVDEGGVVVSSEVTVVFGHAIYESLVRGWRAPVAAAIPLEVVDAALPRARFDAALARFVADEARLSVPRDLRRVAF